MHIFLCEQLGVVAWYSWSSEALERGSKGLGYLQWSRGLRDLPPFGPFQMQSFPFFATDFLVPLCYPCEIRN